MMDARDRRGCRERGSREHGCAHDRLRREREGVTAKASVLFYAGRALEWSRWTEIRMRKSNDARHERLLWCIEQSAHARRIIRLRLDFYLRLLHALIAR
jgi:hypothetical protein